MIEGINNQNINPASERIIPKPSIKSKELLELCVDEVDITSEKDASREEEIGINSVKIPQEVMTGIYNISEVTTVLIQACSDVVSEAGMTGTLAKGAGVGKAVSGLFFTYSGIRDLKNAIKDKNTITGLTAAGKLALAGDAAITTARTLSASPEMAKMIGSSGVSLINSPVFSAISKALGVVYGSSEIIEGGKLVHDAIKHKNNEKLILGALNVGMGVSAIALFLHGGLSTAIVLGVMSVAELAVFGTEKAMDAINEKKNKMVKTS